MKLDDVGSCTFVGFQPDPAVPRQSGQYRSLLAWDVLQHAACGRSISAVQLLEAAAILSHFNPEADTGSSLPEDRGMWPRWCSGGVLEGEDGPASYGSQGYGSVPATAESFNGFGFAALAV